MKASERSRSAAAPGTGATTDGRSEGARESVISPVTVESCDALRAQSERRQVAALQSVHVLPERLSVWSLSLAIFHVHPDSHFQRRQMGEVIVAALHTWERAFRHRLKYACLTFISLLTASFAGIAAAAPDVYFPSRVYLSGTLYYEPGTMANATEQRQGYPVEAWYFDDVCIISRTAPYRLSLLGGIIPRFVHAYWYDDTAPDGDFCQQQWVSPGMNPLTINDMDFAPREVRESNPLWHLIHYRRRNRENLESPVAAKNQPATGTMVLLHDPPHRDQNVHVTFDNNYVIHDDRILSATHVVNTKYLAPKSHADDDALVTQQLVASRFDEKFPAIPRHLHSKHGHPNLLTITTFESQRVDQILPEITPQDVINHITVDLQRVHHQQLNQNTLPEPDAISLENLEDGAHTSAKALLDNEIVLIFTWASWAPDDLWDPMTFINETPPLGMMQRLKDIYKKYKSSPDVTIIGISVDADPEKARAFARKHEMPWQNYLAPKNQRANVVAMFGNGEVPGVTAYINGGQTGNSSIEAILGSPGSSDENTTTPFEEMVHRHYETKRAADKAGGYARSWVGVDAIKVMENSESVEVLQLTGDHTAELMFGTSPMPLLPPPPPGSPGASAHIPAPTPRLPDLPTSVGVLVEKYPITAKGEVKNRRSAREVVKLVLSDEMVAGRSGEEAFPSPERAIVFHRGDDAVSLVYDGLLEVYLNNDRIAWLALTEEGSARFDELYIWLAKDAGLPPEDEISEQTLDEQ